MPCLVPFDNRNLDVSFFVFRPVSVIVDDLVGALRWFSLSCEDQGCAYSAVLKSIHGNLVIWYGAWIKRSEEEKKLLMATLICDLREVSSLGILLDHGFFEPYAGESKEGYPSAKFTTGDTISMTALLPNPKGLEDLSYACLAILKSNFLKMEGVTSVVCFKCSERPRVASLHLWKSLQSCYTWLLGSERGKTIAPYIKHLSSDVEYDVFRVAYVSNDDITDIQLPLPRQSPPIKEGHEEEEFSK